MKLILAIAKNTFRETIRDRILYNLLFFALALISASWIISEWSLGQEFRVMTNFGLSIMTLFGLLMAIFIGIGLVYKEIERRTLYVILARPIQRYHFLLGKYLGLLATLALNFLVMTAGLMAVLSLYGSDIEWRLMTAVVLIFMEMTIVMAFALLFSSITTPTLSAMFSIFIYIAGHLSSDFLVVGPGVHAPAFETALNVLHLVLPNLENFNLRSAIVHNLPFTAAEVYQSIAYGACYAMCILILAVMAFERRNFK